MDTIENFKAGQKQMWPSFAPLEVATTAPAADLVRHSGVVAGQRVLDVACGTGVVSVTAARLGCRVTGLDFTPELLLGARHNASLAEVTIEWHEGDLEAMPFPEASFDAVLSQFGHMFAPRPEVAVGEMLRVLRPGGTIAFSTWPPELFVGRRFQLMAGYTNSLPEGIPQPALWGDPNVVRERLGAKVKNMVFDRGRLLVPTLSPRHYRVEVEKSSPNLMKLVRELEASDPAKLERLRQEYEALTAVYFRGNRVRQDFLMTRATKL